MSENTDKTGRFMAYYRVSTEQQGKSGLGLEAQRKAVLDYLNGGDWELIGEFTEVESGKRSDRPELDAALKLCKRRKATLVIAKLDRLARNVHFISGLMEKGAPFVAVEFPNADPGRPARERAPPWLGRGGYAVRATGLSPRWNAAGNIFG